MLHLKQIKKIMLPGIIGAAAILSSTASMADPVVLPPDRTDLVAVPPVFCFKVTGGDNLTGGGARIQFEVLNWTGEAAYGVKITQEDFNPSNTGGLFDVTMPTASTNGWHASAGYAGEVGQQVIFTADQSAPVFDFGLANSVQTPIQGIDLDPNNDFNYSDAPTLPNPVDSGINTLDGFILDFPDFNVFERVVLQWDLLNEFGQNVDQHANGVRNPFSFGTFQIDRASNGSIRVATYFSIGTDLYDVPYNAAPLDEALTEANAITLAPTSAVPVPAAAWLMLSGLAGLVGVARKRGKKTV